MLMINTKTHITLQVKEKKHMEPYIFRPKWQLHQAWTNISYPFFYDWNSTWCGSGKLNKVRQGFQNLWHLTWEWGSSQGSPNQGGLELNIHTNTHVQTFRTQHKHSITIHHCTDNDLSDFKAQHVAAHYKHIKEVMWSYVSCQILSPMLSLLTNCFKVMAPAATRELHAPSPYTLPHTG